MRKVRDTEKRGLKKLPGSVLLTIYVNVLFVFVRQFSDGCILSYRQQSCVSSSTAFRPIENNNKNKKQGDCIPVFLKA